MILSATYNQNSTTGDITITFDNNEYGTITGELTAITKNGESSIGTITNNTITFTQNTRILLLGIMNNNTWQTFITYDSLPDYIKNYNQ